MGAARLGFCTACRTPDVMTMPSRWTGEPICQDCDNDDDMVVVPVVPARRTFELPPGFCPSCDSDRDTRGPKPPHDASDRCRSGSRMHCTCDACF